jgi:hypothetical protein
MQGELAALHAAILEPGNRENRGPRKPGSEKPGSEYSFGRLKPYSDPGFSMAAYNASRSPARWTFPSSRSSFFSGAATRNASGHDRARSISVRRRPAINARTAPSKAAHRRPCIRSSTSRRQLRNNPTACMARLLLSWRQKGDHLVMHAQFFRRGTPQAPESQAGFVGKPQTLTPVSPVCHWIIQRPRYCPP